MVTAREGTQGSEGAANVNNKQECTAVVSVVRKDLAENSISEQELKEVTAFCLPSHV